MVRLILFPAVFYKWFFTNFTTRNQIGFRIDDMSIQFFKSVIFRLKLFLKDEILTALEYEAS